MRSDWDGGADGCRGGLGQQQTEGRPLGSSGRSTRQALRQQTVGSLIAAVLEIREVRVLNEGSPVAEVPKPYEVHRSGAYLHGTKADLQVGDLLRPGYGSNFDEGRISNHVYFTATLDAATWGAELAAGEGRGRIFIVQPTGPVEDDPNLTDKKFPGNPLLSHAGARAGDRRAG